RGDVAARALRAAVPAVVVAVHGAVARGEPGADVVVTAAVLGEAVHEDQRAARLRGQPAAPEQPDRAIRGGEARLGAPYDPAPHARTLTRARARRQLDTSSRRTSCRAARTRSREL